jgi:mono/diheme cytochrome c family protein
MPAFGERLSEDETTAILDFIKSKWGREEREFQWWITATSDGS